MIKSIFLRIVVFILGAGMVIVCGIFTLLFFFKEERILLVFPSLAQRTTIEILVEQPEKYLESWVLVKGRIFAIKSDEAIIIPDDERQFKNESAAFEKYLAMDNSIQDAWINTEQRKLMLPPDCLYIHEVPTFGRITFDWREAEENDIFTFVGEFEDPGNNSGNPHFHVVGSIQPRQHAPLATIGVIIFCLMLGTISAFFLLKVALRRDR